MNILVVDDDQMILDSISHFLNTEGYHVITADDGLKALDIIEKRDLDLIISDILMPNLSGLSLISLLKQFYFNKIPVILISALNQSPVILSSLGLGTEDFISKPINFEELLSKVKKYKV